MASPLYRDVGPSPPAGHYPSWLDSLYLFQQPRWQEELPNEGEEGEAASESRSDDDGGSAFTMRRTWTVDEDQLLSELVKKVGPRRWAQIAQRFQGRTSKQCHQR